MEKTYNEQALTPMQNNYLLGENSELELGGKNARIYFSTYIEKFKKEDFERAVSLVLFAHKLNGKSIDSSGGFWINDDSNQVKINYKNIDDIKLDIDDIEHYIEHIEDDKTFLSEISVEIEHNGNAMIYFSFSALLMDGNSVLLFLNQLHDAYIGNPLPEASDYCRYVKELDDYKSSEEYKDSENFYCDLIEENNYEELEIGKNNTQVLNKKGFIKKKINPEQIINIKDWCRKKEISTSVFYMTLYSYVLARYSNQNEFYINMPIGIRYDNIKNIYNSIGLYSNFMIVPIKIDKDKTIVENMILLQENLYDILDNWKYPGNQQLKILREKKGYFCLVPYVFSDLSGFKTCKKDVFELYDLKIQSNQVLLEADIVHLSDGTYLTIAYEQQYFDIDLVSRIADTFIENINCFIENVKKSSEIYSIELCNKDKTILEQYNNTKNDYSYVSLPELLEESFSVNKKETAVIYNNIEYTYQKLENDIAAFQKNLQSDYEIGGQQVLGILLPKCYEQFVCSLGVFLMGNIYLPLETELTTSQLISCIHKVSIKQIITTKQYENIVKEIQEQVPIKVIYIETLSANNKNLKPIYYHASPQDIGIMINTSGSTGNPKTIMLKHIGLAHCMVESKNIFNISEPIRLLAITNFCHDMSLFDILGVFLWGGCVIVPNDKNKNNPYYWLDLLHEYKINVWNSVPSFMETLLMCDPEKENSLKTIILGGEFLKKSVAEKIKKTFKGSTLYNVGGPTETTVWNISHKVTSEDISKGVIPYGRPFPNTQYRILNKEHEICPIGVSGEMFCQGISVSGGYVGQEELTNEKFFLWNGSKGYNTGDMGYLNKDGEIIITGRSDLQIKIHGKRIELSGIEKVMDKMSKLSTTSVIYLKEKDMLCMFYSADHEIPDCEIKEFISSYLASYMIPQKYIFLEQIPLTRNGKPDRKQLEKIALQILETSNKNNQIALKNKQEQELLEILQEVIGKNITLNDNYYTVGGDSLDAMKISALIYQKYKKKISVYQILDSNTIGEWIEETLNELNNM